MGQADDKKRKVCCITLGKIAILDLILIQTRPENGTLGCNWPSCPFGRFLATSPCATTLCEREQGCHWLSLQQLLTLRGRRRATFPAQRRVLHAAGTLLGGSQRLSQGKWLIDPHAGIERNERHPRKMLSCEAECL